MQTDISHLIDRYDTDTYFPNTGCQNNVCIIGVTVVLLLLLVVLEYIDVFVLVLGPNVSKYGLCRYTFSHEEFHCESEVDSIPSYIVCVWGGYIGVIYI